MKRLRNTTGSDILVIDTGTNIAAGTTYTIPGTDYGLWTASSNAVTHIGSGALVVNDGSADLSISDGIDLIKGLTPKQVQLLGADGVTKASIILDSGIGYLKSQTQVTIDELLGFDNLADTWFKIDTVGSAGNSWTIAIPSDSVSVVVSVTATEAGNPTKMAEKIVIALNLDATFALKWRARKVKDNPIVWISSAFIGEVGERTGTAYTVTSTGGTRTLGFTDIVRRKKTTSLSRDEKDPRIAFLGITGRVEVTPGGVSDIFITHALNGVSSDLRVNGSVTPVNFTISADATKDLFVSEIRLYGNANGIKFGQFLSSPPLANGILITLKSDDKTLVLPALKTTDDLKHIFTFGPSGIFDLDVQAGRDDFLASMSFSNAPFPLRRAGTFTTDDYVQVKIQDNLSSGILDLRFVVFGFRREV